MEGAEEEKEEGEEEGRAFTLNDWDRAGREGQTEMLKEERQMENDRCVAR